jgi:TfoX/Sxy family transcriptional regulator of competence genes
MTHDEKLAERIRRALTGDLEIAEKTMFGGLAFLSRGKMFCGIVEDDLMVRVGPDAYAQALRQPHARPMDFTGKPMKGYVFVGPKGVARQPSVTKWVRRGVDFVSSLPTASAGRSSRRKAKRG